MLLLLVLLLLWVSRLLGRGTLVLFGAIAVYPALSAIAPFGVDPSEWGPIVCLLLLLLRIIGCKLLLLVLLICDVLWRWRGRVAVLVLQEGIQIVLVLLLRRGQVRTRPPLALIVPPRGLQTVAAGRA